MVEENNRDAPRQHHAQRRHGAPKRNQFPRRHPNCICLAILRKTLIDTLPGGNEKDTLAAVPSGLRIEIRIARHLEFAKIAQDRVTHDPAGVRLSPLQVPTLSNMVPRRKSLHPLALWVYLAAIAQSAGSGYGQAETRQPLWAINVGAPVYASAAVRPDGSITFGAGDNRVWTLSPGGQVVWQFATGDWVDASPAILSGGEVVAASWDRRVYRLSQSGALDWQYTLNALVEASPAIGQNGTIYVGATDFFLYALSASGTLLWEYLAPYEIVSSPVVDLEGNIYFGCRERVGLDRYRGVVVALSPAGQERWIYRLPNDTLSSSRILASPALDELVDVLYVGYGETTSAPGGTTEVGGGLLALTTSGDLIWNTPLDERTDAPPAVGVDGTVYVGTRGGFLHAVTPAGSIAWSVAVGDIFYSGAAVAADGTVFSVGYNTLGFSRLSSIRHTDGSVLWAADLSGVVDATPVIAPDGVLYVGTLAGQFYAFPTGKAPGERFWSRFRGDRFNSGNAFFSISQPSGLLALFPGASSLGEGWYEVPEIGFVLASAFPWVFLPSHGWWYAVSESTHRTWFYDLSPPVGWVWTGTGVYPYLWSASRGTWQVFFEGYSPRQFYDLEREEMWTD